MDASETTKRSGPGIAQRTGIEREIAGIWQKILAIPPPDRDDNFFLVGGNSLAALRLVDAFYQRFGTRVALAQLLSNPTIAELAVLLGDGCETGTRPRPRLQGAASGVPLFHIPGWYGHEFLPRTLASAVGLICPFHDGLQYPGVDGNESPLSEVTSIAERLVDQIKALWEPADGPICLSGHSFGGIMAYEVARLLGQAEQSVALVILLDSFLKSTNRRRSWWEVIQVVWTRTQGLPSGSRMAFLRELMRNKFYSLSNSPSPATQATDSSESLSSRVEKILLCSQMASARYEPRPYYGSVTLLKGTDLVPNNWLRTAPGDDYGWKHWARGQFETIALPIQHHHFTREPIPDVLTDQFAALIRKVQPSSKRHPTLMA